MSTLQTLRSVRVSGVAAFDLVSSIIGTIVIFLVAKRAWYPDLQTTPFIIGGAVLAVPIGVVAHVLTGTDTILNHKLGLSHKPA